MMTIQQLKYEEKKQKLRYMYYVMNKMLQQNPMPLLFQHKISSSELFIRDFMRIAHGFTFPLQSSDIESHSQIHCTYIVNSLVR